MFVLKKALTPFLLPPGIFILFLISSGVFLLISSKRKAGLLNFITGCLMWALSISPVSNAMLEHLESDFSPPSYPQGDVIIVLDSMCDDKLSNITNPVALQKKLQVPVIISGRGAHGVKRCLVDLGIPQDQLIIEDRSKDTLENAKYTRDLCITLGYKKPILVTPAYHLKRSIMSFQKAGIEVVPFPVGFRSKSKRNYEWYHYLPGNFKDASIAIKEYLGLIFYNFVY